MALCQIRFLLRQLTATFERLANKFLNVYLKFGEFSNVLESIIKTVMY